MAAYASKGRNVSMVAALDKLDILRLVSEGVTVTAPKEELPVLAIGTVTSLAVIMIVFLFVSFMCYHRKHRIKNKSQRQYAKASHLLERRRIGAPTSLSLTLISLSHVAEEKNCHDVITNGVESTEEEKYIDDDSCIHFIDMDPIIFHYHKDLKTPLIPENKPIDQKQD